MSVNGEVIIRDITEQEVVSIVAAFGCYRIGSKCKPKNQGCYASILNGNFCHRFASDLATGFCQAEFHIAPTHSNIDAGFVHQAIERAIRDSVFRKAKIQYDLSWEIDGMHLNWESHVVDIEYFIPPGRGCPQKTDDELHPYPDYKNVTRVVLSEANMVGGTPKEKKKEISKEEVKAELLKIIELIKKL